MLCGVLKRDSMKENGLVKQFFRYDIAFSFLEKDEKLASEINQVVKARISSFLYSEKQKDLAGKDGEKEFIKVFGQEARLVVVLYSLEWGNTPWTRIEETAIRNRGFSDGYDFVLFIITEAALQPPKWLPKNRLWFGLDRYGIEGAAAVIEARVQELNGEVRELKAVDKAIQKAKEIEFEHSRQEFINSQAGVDSAKNEVASLFSEIKKILSQIQSQNLKFNIDGDGRELIVYSSGYTLSLYWSTQYANSLKYSSLLVRIFEGSSPFKNRLPIEDPKRLSDEKYYFDMVITGHCGWRFSRHNEEFFTTNQLVSRCMEKLMNRIKTSNIRD